MPTIKENVKYINGKFIVYSDRIIYRGEVDRVGAEDILSRLGLKLNGPLIKAFNKEWYQKVEAIHE